MIKVTSRAGILQEIQKCKFPPDVISIYSSGDLPVDFSSVKVNSVLSLQFDDITQRYEEEKYKHLILFDSTHATQIKEFAENFYPPAICSLIIHCDAGVSRSAAVAFAIYEWMMPEGYVNPFTQENHYIPNPTVVRELRKVFKTGYYGK